jgi:hypothetical protein
MDLDSPQNGMNIFSQVSSKQNVRRQVNEVNKPHICTFCQKKFARYINIVLVIFRFVKILYLIKSKGVIC